jgi:hypothetical protein
VAQKENVQAQAQETAPEDEVQKEEIDSFRRYSLEF